MNDKMFIALMKRYESEIEDAVYRIDAINEHKSVVESAVIGVPHPIKGKSLLAFMIPYNEDIDKKTLKDEVNEIITKMIGPIAKLDQAIIVPGLPKTRSGKIMRRVLRKIATNDLQNLGDTSTLLNPEIVDIIIGKVNESQRK